MTEISLSRPAPPIIKKYLHCSPRYDIVISQAEVVEWQTRWTQNPLLATTCGFKSHLRHQKRSDELLFFVWRRNFCFAKVIAGRLGLERAQCGARKAQCAFRLRPGVSASDSESASKSHLRHQEHSHKRVLLFCVSGT